MVVGFKGPLQCGQAIVVSKRTIQLFMSVYLGIIQTRYNVFLFQTYISQNLYAVHHN